MSEDPAPGVRYYVRCRDGDFVIELPPEYKVTFGAVNPGAPPHGHDLHCLRVWDGPNAKTAHLRAVFCNVSGLRDLSLPVARKVTRETGSASWTRDDDSSLMTEKRELEHSYATEDPDEIPF